jgi:hypothetical protein
MIITTRSGSVYEFDTQNHRARRVVGTTPTPNRISNGMWAPYIGLVPEVPVPETCVLIIWSDGKFTRTSYVEKVVN